jgi:hypothetical protein
MLLKWAGAGVISDQKTRPGADPNQSPRHIGRWSASNKSKNVDRMLVAGYLYQ